MNPGQPPRQPQRLPLAVSPSNRDETTNRDAKLINGFLEQVSQEETWVYKRPGTTIYSTAAAAAGLGCYSWNGDVYTIWGATLYKNNVAIVGVLDTTGGVYTFSSTLGATPKLFLTNGVFGYAYDTAGGLVKVTDADFPTTFCKGSAYLDGVTYVMDTKANIQGSDPNDPLTWDPLNKLVAQIEPDGGVCLAKQLVYVVAFKQWSVEIFYDAGNATGSPLGAVQGAKLNVGCRHADTVRELEGTLFWVSQARDGSVSVMLMDGLKSQSISTPAVERLLQQDPFTTVYSWTAKLSGHKFYAITLVVTGLTLVFDLTAKRWYQWAEGLTYMPHVASTFSSSQIPLLQDSSDGNLYALDMAHFTDYGKTIYFDLYTPNYDGGTRMTKYLNNLDFVADQTTGSTLYVRNSDDDYQTWTNFRKIDLGSIRPRLTGCGSFRRRAYHLRHTANTPLRIKAVEMQVDLGTL